MPVSRLLVSGIVMVAVVLVAFVVLVATGALASLPALIACAAIVLVQGVLLRALFSGLADVRRGLYRMIDEPMAAAPSVHTSSPAFNQLWRSITRLARLLRERVARLESELAAAQAVLASVPDPMLLLNDRRGILRANGAAIELFGPNLPGRDLAVAIRTPALLQAADAVLQGGGARVIEFELSAPVSRHLRARIEPLADQPTDGGAALLTMTDLTTLKRTEQMRADFVANASHELRTPLATLIGFIETLEGPAADDAEARARFLPIMRQQALRMSRLVDDLLSLSRIELNEHQPPRGRVELGTVLKTVIQTLDLRAAARGMAVELGLEIAPPALPGDSDELAQVFQNLIDNAIKYGAEGTPITVRVQASAKLRQGVAIAVRDRGEGIQRRHLPRLTERFYRVDTARSRAMGGTGLGLAIVKHIISRHRGLLEIESEIGVGSTFTVHLPTALARSDAVIAGEIRDAASG